MYIYRTKGICPPEIHFELSGNTLKNVLFVGGGCKGNARLITRLLEGREVVEVLPLLRGVQCRNDTSCPDQLCLAIESALTGQLEEAAPVKIFEVPGSYHRVAVIAELNGNLEALRASLSLGVDAVCCLGSLTGPGGDNDTVAETARRANIILVRGPLDSPDGCVKPENREYLCNTPHFLSFSMGGKRVVGFYGGYIQEIEGFSDFSRFSLELLMVSRLSDYLRSEEVYPALSSMAQQFEADVVLFAHTGLQRHVQLGRVDFINVGAVDDGGRYSYALLRWEGDHLEVSFETV